MNNHSRREFIKRSSALVLASSIGSLPPLATSAEKLLREFKRGGMRYRRLGQTELFVSSLSYGSHTDPRFKKKSKHGNVLTPEGQSRRDRQIARALDLGVNMVDTYENAGQWEPVARLVSSRRDKVLISLCRQFSMFVGENIDRAAKMFGHVDLYRIYIGDAPGVDNRILEDWDVMRKAKAAGKVRAIGISTHSERMMVSVINELEGLDYIMFPYNFIHARADYSEFLPAAIKKRIGLIAIKPLAAGSIVRLDPNARSGSKPESEQTELYHASSKTLLPSVVAELTRELKQTPGESLCQAALRFVYSRPFITSAMPGMFEEHELSENYAALKQHIKLGRADSAVLDNARRVAKLSGQKWLPQHYRWLDKQWLA
jgi:aryl-alcohol dehydrogenase-like predicted oxidoreductase